MNRWLWGFCTAMGLALLMVLANNALREPPTDQEIPSAAYRCEDDKWCIHFVIDEPSCEDAMRDRLLNLSEPTTVEGQLAAAEHVDRACERQPR